MNYSSFLGVTSVTGQNGDSGSAIYDATARPSSSTSPYGAQTTYNYYDTAVPPYKQATTNGHWAKTIMDGFGRTIEAQTGNGTTVVSNVDTNYGPCGCSPLGKVNATSQPYALLANRVWTNYYYDGLGRTLTQVLPDGSTTTYLYAGNTVKVTDPAGKWKLFTSDAFGNLTQVQEPDPKLGTVPTQYTYDMLNHLTNVSMLRSGTTQQRVFNYIDPSTGMPGALLRSAQNPENGTVSYTYNANNLLSTKTDAKNQVLTYTYDSYNRPYQVLSGSTVLRTFYYDTNPLDSTGQFSQYPTGRLTAVQYLTQATSVQLVDMYSYTQAGLPATKRLQVNEPLGWVDKNNMQHGNTGTANLDVGYTYNSEGKILSMTYPTTTAGAGPSYNYSFDPMWRLSGMTGPGNSTIVNNVSYGPANELLTINYSSIAETRTYNNLLQLTNVTAGSLNMTYAYPAGSNNGKASSQTDGTTGETVQYTYDSLNRLITAQAGSTWGDSYTYDGFGNLTAKTPTAGSAPSMSVGIDPTTNRLSVVYGVSYDANGNMTEMPSGGSYITLGYDVENRLSSVSSTSTSYYYDASNRRVWSWAGGHDVYGFGNTDNYQLAVYSPSGQKVATYQITVYNNSVNQGFPNLVLNSTLLSSDMYFGGRRLAPMDRLSSAGKYYPYGEDKGTIYSDTWNFATYWRDSATGLDYAMNRYYSNSLGRFMTPDPSRASGGPGNPQSWNRYSYVQNDPANALDPGGLLQLHPEFAPTEGGGQDCWGCGTGPIGDCDPSDATCDDPPCVGADGFTPNPSPFCQTGGPPPPPTPPQQTPQPTCAITEFSRSTPRQLDGPANHTYIEIFDPAIGLDEVLEGEPTKKPKFPNPYGGDWGNLVGRIDPIIAGVLTGAINGTTLDPNSIVASLTGGGAVCQDAVTLDNEVKTYNMGAVPLSRYRPVPKKGSGYANSNSFTFTLLFDIGLTGAGWKPGGWSPGWGIFVPGL